MRRASLLVVVLTLVLLGCSASASSTIFQLSEFSIAGPERLDPGTSSLTVANSGELPHTLVVTKASGEVVAATGLIQPGETSALEVDLEEGRYSFTCRIVAENDRGEIVDHFEAGMVETVQVGG